MAVLQPPGAWAVGFYRRGMRRAHSVQQKEVLRSALCTYMHTLLVSRAARAIQEVLVFHPLRREKALPVRNASWPTVPCCCCCASVPCQQGDSAHICVVVKAAFCTSWLRGSRSSAHQLVFHKPARENAPLPLAAPHPQRSPHSAQPTTIRRPKPPTRTPRATTPKIFVALV